MSPKSMTGVLLKRGNLDTEPNKENIIDDGEMMEADIEGIFKPRDTKN